ncbi:MAG: winged helix-turn-helix transcriptional regulator [Gammaproteobacteria bacterium]|nr:winged helix-turn-helix transcriptional regulator [Gammaproteobacteria bacterium]
MKKNYMRALPKAWARTADVFMALGDSHRQRILLTFDKHERLTITQIAAIAPLSRTAVTHHVRTLEQAGILVAEKCGREVLFHIDAELLKHTLQSVMDYINDNV